MDNLQQLAINELKTRGAWRYLEPAATMVTGAIAEPISGMYGLITLPGGTEGAAQNVEDLRSALTYMPKTEQGKEGLEAVGQSILGYAGEAFEDVSQMAGDFAYDVTGSPVAGALGSAIPAAALEALGVRHFGKAGQQAARANLGTLRMGPGPVDKVTPSKAAADIPSPLFGEDNRLSNINKSGGMWQAIKSENPNVPESGKVTVYRATIGDKINPNDYVALDRNISELHLENLKDRGEAGRVISEEVDINDLMMANDATEFVYTPHREPAQ